MIIHSLIVADKLFSMLMHLGKIVLQVGCSDKIIKPISSTSFIHHLFIWNMVQTLNPAETLARLFFTFQKPHIG
jgi:hypothetical protein